MRISRKRRPKKDLLPHFKINDRITAPEIRLIDEAGENLGVFSLEAALEKARELELDLVEINPKIDPPVAQLKNFKHFKYQKEKELRKQKVKSHTGEVKGIRLSVRIGLGDIETKKKQAIKFLERGDKIKLEIILRGAEKYKSELGFDMIAKFFTLLNEAIPVKYDQEAQRQGVKIIALVTKQSPTQATSTEEETEE
ncbi:MAG: translation initiation factor IF-3 [Candidatus Magasanikbacteria bacterium]|jgi:translation initiation factor IF-3|nr:translation initiation factor IF-3 [Candidatus Magasanikbacteria bacterium]